MLSPVLLAVADGESFNAGELIIHHVSDSHDWGFGLSKAVLMMAIAGLLMLLVALRAVKGYDENGVPTTRLAQMIDPFIVHFYRDIALPYVGKKWAPRVTPLLLNFFFFILFCNLLGLLPLSDLAGLVGHYTTGHEPFFVEGAATATGNFNVTATLAVITFVSIQVLGVIQNGLGAHLAHFMGPPSAPWAVRVLLLIPIEIISAFVKPFALTMRLAANMTAGHMALLALLSIPFLLKSVWVGAPVVLIALAITMLEIIVCFVQAYVFALLSGVFIGMAVHSHH
ncbi:MAG: F0F1 ATP synthase subunit A [Acidobacteriota bacterium]|nr:MAG: F0F1 ATP synthase subunit A [Acidobacteriota bacterium]